MLCAFPGPRLGLSDVQLCFTSHGRNGSWVCSPPFLWQAGGGLIPCCRALEICLSLKNRSLGSIPGEMRDILILRSPEQEMA